MRTLLATIVAGVIVWYVGMIVLGYLSGVLSP
jgi:hypothetical protein